jgi:hypothetical protein
LIIETLKQNIKDSWKKKKQYKGKFDILPITTFIFQLKWPPASKRTVTVNILLNSFSWGCVFIQTFFFK